MGASHTEAACMYSGSSCADSVYIQRPLSDTSSRGHAHLCAMVLNERSVQFLPESSCLHGDCVACAVRADRVYEALQAYSVSGCACSQRVAKGGEVR